MLKRVTARVLFALLRRPWVWKQAERLYRWYGRHRPAVANIAPAAAGYDAGTVIPEIAPLSAWPSPLSEPRLNLCVPSLSEQHVFGGIATALHLFDELSAGFDHLRIILTDAAAAPGDIVERYADWKIVTGGDGDCAGRLIFQATDRRGSIPVRKNDYFVATAWWTAWLVRGLLRWQKNEYELRNRRFVYLIQDYEPGFYAWSSHYVLAEATYRHPEEIVAIFNTRMLREHFEYSGYAFDRVFVFEPRLNEQLAAYRSRSPRRQKERTIMIYGRPSTPRNAFALIVLALQIWAQSYSRAAAWRVVSVGEPHADIPLEEGIVIESLGKLALADYAEVLDSAAIGISLMISPHPSYPPLEMASFGVRVITNGYGPKDLSKLHTGIVSVAVPEPENIARELGRLCDAFESDQWTNQGGNFIDGTFEDGRGGVFFSPDGILRALGSDPGIAHRVSPQTGAAGLPTGAAAP
jgi:hypothetical protein